MRGSGYDEFRLLEKRHPTRRDLDAAIPGHPVKLGHRSGHGTVLNSRAMALAGIDITTPEPVGGYIDREIETGEPTGLFVDLDGWLDDRLGSQPRGDEMGALASRAAGELPGPGHNVLPRRLAVQLAEAVGVLPFAGRGPRPVSQGDHHAGSRPP